MSSWLAALVLRRGLGLPGLIATLGCLISLAGFAGPPLPTVIVPGGGGDQPPAAVSNLPNVIGPGERGRQAGSSGTGFFIAADASLLTVAHVVSECRAIQVASRYFPATRADAVAVDAASDLAVLRVPGVRPPGVLALAQRPDGAPPVTIWGYPGDADGPVASQLVGRLRTGHPTYDGVDTRDLLWIEADKVRAGFSGAPVLGPGGEAIGVINGNVVLRGSAQGRGGRDAQIAFGASTRMIDIFLARAVPALARQTMPGAAAGAADRAIVQVLCWREPRG